MAAEPLPLESVPLQDLSAAQNQGQQDAVISEPTHDAAQIALDATVKSGLSLHSNDTLSVILLSFFPSFFKLTVL